MQKNFELLVAIKQSYGKEEGGRVVNTLHYINFDTEAFQENERSIEFGEQVLSNVVGEYPKEEGFVRQVLKLRNNWAREECILYKGDVYRTSQTTDAICSKGRGHFIPTRIL